MNYDAHYYRSRDGAKEFNFIYKDWQREQNFLRDRKFDKIITNDENIEFS